MDNRDREALDPKWFKSYYEFFDLGTDHDSQRTMMKRMLDKDYTDGTVFDYEEEVKFQKTMGVEDANVDDKS